MPKKYNINLMSQSTRQLGKILILSALSLLFVSACSKEEAVMVAPPPAVSVYTIKTQSIGNYREFVARTVASNEAKLRARVEGEILKRHFKEGAIVQKDQVLLEIDPAAYKANLAAAKADLLSSKAAAESTARDLTRGKELSVKGFISQSDIDKLTTNAAQAAAAVKVAQSSVEKAELDLSYTQIVAPFTGRIGKVAYDVGNVVGPNSDSLAVITLTDPMRVSFQVEESIFINFQQKYQNVEESERKINSDISLRLPNNTMYEENGVLDFADTKIQQGMGTVELMALFPNPKDIILPGLFVTLIVENRDKQDMALVPQAAVQENQQGKFVLVVDENNKIVQRLVVLGRRINAMWLVESGLNTGDRVVVEGLQKVKPGTEVNPVNKAVDGLTGTISDADAK